MRTTRRPVTAGLAALALAALAGCAGADPEPTVTSTVPPAATTEPEPSPEPEPVEESPSPSPTTEPEPEPEPAPTVELTATSVGGIPVETPDPLPQLVALLGPPDAETTVEQNQGCGSGEDASASWGDLDVIIRYGTLAGWFVDGPAVPEQVVLPHGIGVGDPIGDVTAATGAAPTFDEQLGRFVAQQDAVSWWAEAEDPASPVTWIYTAIIYCS